jgi:hypothetical protein
MLLGREIGKTRERVWGSLTFGTDGGLAAMRSFYTLLLLVLGAGALHAQIDTAGRWVTSDAGSRSVFPADDYQDIYLGFDDSLRLYASVYREDNTRRTLGSSDGGTTWSDVPDDEWSYTEISSTIRITANGRISRDAGATWTQIEFPSDDTLTRMIGLRAVGRAPFIAVEYHRFRWDSVWRGYERRGPRRLAFSTDAGSTWEFADSTTPETPFPPQWIPERLRDTTMFGPLPHGDSAAPVSWLESSIEMFDPGHLIVISQAHDPSSTKRFIGHLDLPNRTARWYPLDTYTPAWVSSSEAYATTRIDARGEFLVRTDDEGRSWDTVALPEWIGPPPRYFRFHSPGVIIASNGVSHDGGRSWRRSANPFGLRTEYLDSAHLFMTGRRSFFARSSDAGRTWDYSFGSATVNAIAAHDGSVVIAREYRSLLVSGDTGRSWRDVGYEGAFPADFSQVHALIFDDTTRRPRHVIGIARFVPYDSIPYAAIVESDDAGLTWRLGQRLFDAEYFDFGGTTHRQIAFEMSRDGTTLFATFGNRLFVRDSGGVWIRRPDLPSDNYVDLQMLDERNGFIELEPIFSGEAGATRFFMTDDGAQTLRMIGDRRGRAAPVPFTFVLDSTTIRMIYPEHQPVPIVVTTIDGGRIWDTVACDLPLLRGSRVVWRDTATLYVLSDSGLVHYSVDGGRSFDTLHAVDPDFPIVNRYETWYPISGTDGRFIYVTGAGDRIGRFRMIEQKSEPTVDVDIEKWIPRRIDLR